MADLKLSDSDSADIQSSLEEAEKTIGEAFHSETEKNAIKILESLRMGSADFYANQKDAINFIHYISHQYFRTAKIKKAVIASGDRPVEAMIRTWPIEAFIYATNVASSLIRQRHKYRIVFLLNQTEKPFITGDQPVINLRGLRDQEVDLYYPLTPSVAMILTSDFEQYPEEKVPLGEQEVHHYNNEIYAMSDSQIYGNDPAYLKSLAESHPLVS